MGSFTTNDNITLHHETEGSGPAVLLPHGLPSRIAPAPLAAALPAASAAVVPGDDESPVSEPPLAKSILTFVEA